MFNDEAQTTTSGGRHEQPAWCWLKNREEEKRNGKGEIEASPIACLTFFVFEIWGI